VEYGLGGMKSAREAEDILRAECPCDYAVVRLPKKFEIPGGECGTVISSKPAPKGTRVTPGDVGKREISPNTILSPDTIHNEKKAWARV